MVAIATAPGGAGGSDSGLAWPGSNLAANAQMSIEANTSTAQITDSHNPSDTMPLRTETLSPWAVLLLLALLIAATLFYFLKLQRPSLPDFSGLSERREIDSTLPGTPSPARKQPVPVGLITSDDKDAFQHLLLDIHAAWSKQDLTELRQLATPEMAQSFSAALAGNTNQGIQNRVEDVLLLRAEILEAWSEHATQYVTAKLRWSSLTYTISLTKQQGETGYLISDSEKTPTESEEIWTFMRPENGQWVLSEIRR